MSPESFTFWLQGFVELGGKKPNDQQWQMIKEHLALVFKKVTPTTYCASVLDERICSQIQQGSGIDLTYLNPPDPWKSFEIKNPTILATEDVNVTCGIPANPHFTLEGFTGHPPFKNPNVITDGWVPITC
jgi:hypothetical protein